MKKIFLTIALLTLSIPAIAHDWYPHECCSGQDCAPISSITVAYGFSSSGEEGYHIHLRPGDHKMVKREQRYFVPMRSVQEVPETAPEEAKNQWHVCVGKATQMILCAWKPRTGI